MTREEIIHANTVFPFDTTMAELRGRVGNDNPRVEALLENLATLYRDADNARSTLQRCLGEQLAENMELHEKLDKLTHV